MKVVSLVDNNRLPQRKDLLTEPGLSLCIFTDEQRILFDAGFSGTFRSNADRLNIDIARISLAVLSHHHYDHGGGMAAFLEANTHAKIYLRSSSTEHFYLHLFGLIKRRIGLDESLFQHYPGRFTFINQFSEIASDVFILTKMDQRHPMPLINTLAGWREDIEELGREIMEYPVEKIYTGHCTGTKAYRILREVVGAKLEYFATGCQEEL